MTQAKIMRIMRAPYVIHTFGPFSFIAYQNKKLFFSVFFLSLTVNVDYRWLHVQLYHLRLDRLAGGACV